MSPRTNEDKSFLVMVLDSSPSFDDTPSDELSDIVGRSPGWIIRWGIGSIFIVFIAAAIVTYFIKYPAFETARVVITSDPAPVQINSHVAGPIFLLKGDSTNVKAGDAIAVIKSEVELEDVLLLEQILQGIEESKFSDQSLAVFREHRNFRLGVLAEDHARFSEVADSWTFLNEDKSVKKEILSRQTDLLLLEKQLGNQRQQLAIFHKEIELAKINYSADSILHHSNVISARELSEKKIILLAQLRQAKNVESTILNYQQESQKLEAQIELFEEEQKEAKIHLFSELKNARYKFGESIRQWKEQNVLSSPVDGRIVYHEILNNWQYVKANTPLFSVVPLADKIFAYAILPSRGSGRVMEGQKVNIRLENYPSEQYGMLIGRVSKLTTIPNDEGYILRLELFDGLRTSYNSVLPFRQNLTGETEIITEDIRLLDRIIFKIRKVTQ